MDLPALPTRGYDLEAAYHAHIHYVWATLARFGVRDADLEDGVQDVFVVAHRRRNDFDGTCTMRTWLFGISRRVASDYRRRDRRHDRRVEALALSVPLRVEADGVQRSTESARVLHAFLRSLDEDKRSVFVLTELEQMTSHEVAQALDINRNTVAARLRAARLAFERYGRQLRRPTAAQMLAAARKGERPPARVKARVLGLVLARIDPSATAAALPTSATTVSAMLKAAGVSLAIAAGVLGAIRLAASPQRRPMAVSPAAISPETATAVTHPTAPPRVDVVEHPMPSAPPLASPEAASTQDAPRRQPRRRTTPETSEPPNDDLERQNTQLRAARAALRHGDAARALELASAYEHSFPRGLYGPEFALTRVRALCAQGRVVQARGEASVLARRFPNSPVLALPKPECDPSRSSSTPTATAE